MLLSSNDSIAKISNRISTVENAILTRYGEFESLTICPINPVNSINF